MRLPQLSRFPTTVQMLQKNVLFAKGPSAPLYANFAQIELATVHSGGKSERHIGIDSSVTQESRPPWMSPLWWTMAGICTNQPQILQVWEMVRNPCVLRSAVLRPVLSVTRLQVELTALSLR